MTEELLIIASLFILIGFPLLCGIFCFVVDYKQDELSRMIRKRNNERNGT